LQVQHHYRQQLVLDCKLYSAKWPQEEKTLITVFGKIGFGAIPKRNKPRNKRSVFCCRKSIQNYQFQSNMDTPFQNSIDESQNRYCDLAECAKSLGPPGLDAGTIDNYVRNQTVMPRQVLHRDNNSNNVLITNLGPVEEFFDTVLRSSLPQDYQLVQAPIVPPQLPTSHTGQYFNNSLNIPTPAGGLPDNDNNLFDDDSAAESESDQENPFASGGGRTRIQ